MLCTDRTEETKETRSEKGVMKQAQARRKTEGAFQSRTELTCSAHSQTRATHYNLGAEHGETLRP